MYKYIFGRLVCSGLILSLNILVLSSCSSGSDGVPVKVVEKNTAPVAADFGVSVPPGDSVSGILSVSDAEDDSLIYSVVTTPVNGAVTIDDAGTGAYTYTLNNAADTDSFTFWANDGLLDSNIATVTVTGTVAAAPVAGLQATAGDQRITLNWDAVPGADSYNVYWSGITGTGTGGTLATDVSPPFYHDGVTNGMNYYYVVTSVNAIGESEASSEVTATPVDILLSSLSFDDANLQACVDALGLTYVNELSDLFCQSVGIASLIGIENLTSLTYINFYGNNISDLSALSGLRNLTYLSLNNNSISDISPLSDLTGFTTLGLGSNNISDVAPLSGMSELTNLNLSSNNISDVSLLSGLTSLASLYLDSNNIIDVSPLSGLVGLTLLKLNSNNISDVSPLSNLSNLTYLVLGYNSISDISLLSGLTSLITLALSNNNISDVAPLSGMSGLTDLFLSDNNISDVSPLSSLTSLTDLYLSGMNISDISPLSSLTSLSTLSIAAINISDISSLSGMTSLTVLGLNNNNISDISALSGLTNLTSLYLESNNITDISPLSGLTSLTRLYLHFNNIIDVSPLSGLTNLTRLILDYNNIGGQGGGNVDSLVTITGAEIFSLSGNTGISCNELATLTTALGSPPVDTDFNSNTSDVATNGVNCTNP